MKDLARLLSGKMTPEERGRQTAIDRLMGRSGQTMQPAPPTPPTPAGEVPEPRQRTTSAIANALMKADDGLRRMTPPPLRQKVQDMGAIASAVSPGADMVEMYQQAPQAYRAAREGDLGGAVLGGLGTIAAMAGMGGESKAMRKGIRAFHGTPHDFDRFDMSKIGTGEGAQAYGHGLYFAESEGVARSYRDALTKQRVNTPQGQQFDIKTVGGWDDFAENYLGPQASNAPPLPKNSDRFTLNSYEDLLDDAYSSVDDGADFAGTLRNMSDWLRGEGAEKRIERLRGIVDNNTLRIIQKQYDMAANFAYQLSTSGLSSPPGRMYEVNINADPDEFLDWDRPLSEQPERVQDWASKVGESGGLRARAVTDPSATGQAIWEASRSPFAAKRLGYQNWSTSGPSEAMREAGIPGIKYLDQGSRGAGDGTRNYVVFDDSLIEIVRKYGIAGLVAAGVAPAVIEQFVAQNPEYADQGDS